VNIGLRLLRYLAAMAEPCAGICRDVQTRATSVPARAENYGRQRSPRATRTASDLGTRRLTRCAKQPSKQPVIAEWSDSPAEGVVARSAATRPRARTQEDHP
jgi:hypothetical protein